MIVRRHFIQPVDVIRFQCRVRMRGDCYEYIGAKSRGLWPILHTEPQTMDSTPACIHDCKGSDSSSTDCRSSLIRGVFAHHISR